MFELCSIKNIYSIICFVLFCLFQTFHCVFIWFFFKSGKISLLVDLMTYFLQMLVLWLIQKDAGIKSVASAPQIKNTTLGHLVGSTLVVVSLREPRLTICGAYQANISTIKSKPWPPEPFGRHVQEGGTKVCESVTCVFFFPIFFFFLHSRWFGTFIFLKIYVVLALRRSACVYVFFSVWLKAWFQNKKIIIYAF